MTGSLLQSHDGASDVLAAVASELKGSLPAFLPRQRWYADKHRTIVNIDPVVLTVPFEAGAPLLLAIVQLAFEDGERARYFLPMSVHPTGHIGAHAICNVTIDGTECSLADAAPEPNFHRWLLSGIREGRTLKTAMGTISSAIHTPERMPEADIPGSIAGFEQSNTAILFGARLFAKVYRRLGDGINPDVEIGSYLSGHPTFRESPALIGSIQYIDARGSSTLIMLQEQLRSPVDHWKLVLDAIARGDWRAASVGASLGGLTGRLHLALATGEAPSPFAPIFAGAANVAVWKSALRSSLEHVTNALEERLDSLDEQTCKLAATFLSIAPGLSNRDRGFEALVGLPLIRVHGDYHLGQVLRDAGGRLAVIDFEGEPQRTIDERRMKTSPLKDVAGMLRSFSYARAAAQAAEGGNRQMRLIQWEEEQREDFLASYTREIAAGRLRLLPDGPDTLSAAIAAWEIDKALYEVLYELSSRPDWLWLPLLSLVRFG